VFGVLDGFSSAVKQGAQHAAGNELDFREVNDHV